MADGHGRQVPSFAWSAHGNVWGCPNWGVLTLSHTFRFRRQTAFHFISSRSSGKLGASPRTSLHPLFPLLQNAGGLRLACGSRSCGAVLRSIANMLPHGPAGFPTQQVCVGAWNVCISNTFPGHADAAVWEPHFERPRYAQTFERWTLIITHCFKKSTLW